MILSYPHLDQITNPMNKDAAASATPAATIMAMLLLLIPPHFEPKGVPQSLPLPSKSEPSKLAKSALTNRRDRCSQPRMSSTGSTGRARTGSDRRGGCCSKLSCSRTYSLRSPAGSVRRERSWRDLAKRDKATSYRFEKGLDRRWSCWRDLGFGGSGNTSDSPEPRRKAASSEAEG